jgi:hypothetical protein
MTAVAERILAYFDLGAESGDFFTLDDAVLGELDGVGVLAGEIATNITSRSYAYSVTRGRSFELDEIQTGRAAVELRNYDAMFFPRIPFVTVPGDEELTSDDDEILGDDSGGTGGGLFFGDDPLTFGEDTLIFGLSGEGDPLTVESDDVGFGSADDNIRPGKRITIETEGVVIYDGSVEDWEFAHQATGEVDCRVSAFDALGRLAHAEFDEWTTTDGETTGERIESVLLRGEVDFPLAQTNLDAGTSTLQDDLVSWGSNVHNYLQLVARSELGRLFADRENVLQFRGRSALANPTVKVEFSDTAADGSIGFRSLVGDVSAALLYTDVSVDREGGTAQTVFDADAREEFGIRRLSISGLLVDSDEQCEDIATYLLGVYKSPAFRIRSLVCRLDKLSSADRVKVCQLDIGDVVSLTWTPRGAATGVQQLLVVEGVNHSAAADGPHDVTLTLSLLSGAFGFILDDTDLGVLDSGVLSF